jgi:putative heme iron utilization protein
MKIEQTPQISEQMEHFENFGQTPEVAELEVMIREDRKNELRKLAHNQGLRHET